MVGVIGCFDAQEKYQEEGRLQIAWYKNDLRVGNNWTDPYNLAELVSEDGKETKYKIADGYWYPMKFVTVKQGKIVAVWTKIQ